MVFAPSTLHYEAPPITLSEVQAEEVVVTNPVETLQDQARTIASEYGISFEKLSNLIYSESRWNPNAVSETGDYGLVQINLENPPELEKGQEPITKEQALDPEFSLRFAVRAIKQGQDSAWTVCNCYSLVKSRVRSLPRVKDLKPNTSYPPKNGVVIMQYDVPHYAYIESIQADGIHVLESNFEPCLVSRRVINFNDKKIVGFWNPELVNE